MEFVADVCSRCGKKVVKRKDDAEKSEVATK